MSLIHLVCGVLTAGAMLGDPPPAPAGAVTISLSGVPDRLAFPLPEGSNVIITASVAGAEVRSVMLRVEALSHPGVPLTPVGEGKYQINLADPAVWNLVQDYGKANNLRVWAETVAGETISSVAVCYSVVQPAPPVLMVRTYRCAQPDVPVVCEYHSWWTPGELDRLEVVGGGVAGGAAWATADEGSWRFVPQERTSSLALPLTKEIRDAWGRTGLLRIHHRHGQGHEYVVSALRARPATLQASGNLVKVTVYQRSSMFIPGSNQYLTLRLDDITGGQVLATLETAEGQRLVDTESMRPGTAVDFEFVGQHYTLKTEQFVNKLLGTDYGIFSVSHLALTEREKIDRLLAGVEQSGLIFIRNGEEHPSTAAAAHWRRKFETEGPQVNTLDEFIEKIASRASSTDQPYQVRLRDGTVVETGPWLRAQAAKLPVEAVTRQPEPAAVSPQRNTP
ncbi:MAG TPA: DUF5329 family protein [Phycisphaerae bacterium]|nr:DUF5329 family protein [Phycisphaerae bacterium]HNU45301.1 DUF5329 family protein [Phycisphaerae bacterium]